MKLSLEEKLVANASALIEEFEKEYLIAVKCEDGWLFRERLDNQDLVTLASSLLNLIDTKDELEES